MLRLNTSYSMSFGKQKPTRLQSYMYLTVSFIEFSTAFFQVEMNRNFHL